MYSSFITLHFNNPFLTEDGVTWLFQSSRKHRAQNMKSKLRRPGFRSIISVWSSHKETLVTPNIFLWKRVPDSSVLAFSRCLCIKVCISSWHYSCSLRQQTLLKILKELEEVLTGAEKRILFTLQCLDSGRMKRCSASDVCWSSKDVVSTQGQYLKIYFTENQHKKSQMHVCNNQVIFTEQKTQQETTNTVQVCSPESSEGAQWCHTLLPQIQCPEHQQQAAAHRVSVTHLCYVTPLLCHSVLLGFH